MPYHHCPNCYQMVERFPCDECGYNPNQGSLFDPHSHARTGDADTSHEAAASMEPHAGSLQDRCYDALQRLGGWGTQTEVAGVLGLERGQVHKRLSDLKNAGRIFDSGERRKGATGRNETVWTTREPAWSPNPPF